MHYVHLNPKHYSLYNFADITKISENRINLENDILINRLTD